MNWRTKARLQRAFSLIPVGRENLYARVQRRFGSLRCPGPVLDSFRDAVSIFSEIEATGTRIEGARVVEVGTGNRINFPLAFFLSGAVSIISVDLYRVVQPDIVMRDVEELLRERDEAIRIFSGIAPAGLLSERMECLARCRNFDEIRKTIHLDYRAPGDATATDLPPATADIHFSHTVFEHVPRATLIAILREGSRLVSSSGVMCHHIDLSDHFSHHDRSISAINFLQFPAAEWQRLVSPRFGYQNRLREPDYREIYCEALQNVLVWKCGIDRESLKRIENGFPLAQEYASADPKVLATTSLLAISRPCPQREAGLPVSRNDVSDRTGRGPLMAAALPHNSAMDLMLT